MSVSSSQSRVTLRLDLIGQKATVRGLQQTSAALAELADVATAADEKLTASAESAAAAVDSASKSMTAGIDTTATRWTEASSEMSGAASKVATSADATAAAAEKMATRTSTAVTSASTGVTGLLTSFKALSVGAGTYLGVKAFTSYSTSLTQLSTLAGMTQQQVASLNAEIMRTAPALRQSPAALAQAAYSPASERFGLAGTEQVMAYAARLSNLGGGPIGGGAGSTSYAISTMLQTLGLKPTAQNVAKVTAMIRGTTSAGDMQLSDLTGAMSTGVLNTGKTYGIDPEATLGALAFFTSQGVPAQEAATRMRMTESLMVGQTAQAAKYAKALGLSVTGSDETGLSAQLAGLGLSPTKMSAVLRTGPGGLNAAFAMINQSLASLPADQREAVWAKLFGGGRTDATAMQLAQGATSGQLMNFTSAVIGSSTVGGLNQATSIYNQSPQGQLKQFESQLQTFATQFGSVVMPVLEQLMSILSPLLSLFAQHKVLLDALALLIGGELAFKLLGLVKNLKLVGSAVSAFKDLKGFESIVTGAGEAESAVGKLIQKLTGAKDAWAGMETAEAGAGTAGGGGTAGMAALGLGAAGATVTGGTAAALALGGWGIYSGATAPGRKTTGADIAAGGPGMAAMLNTINPATGKKYTVADLVRLANQKPGPGAVPLSQLNTAGWQNLDKLNFSGLNVPGYAHGGVTDGPMAIVGEGRPQFPEYVIPTDPQYRSRALGLFASLGGHLMAEGGTISGSEIVMRNTLAADAMAGLTAAERQVNQTIAMMVGAAQASTLTKLAATRANTGMSGAVAAAAAAAAGGGASPGGNRGIGQRLAASLGWTGNEWAALNALWTQESGWNNLAKNPSSGAYGIAQALPASKYPLAGQAAGGSDPTAQIQWGLQYIRQRYGDPAAAESHEKTMGWYARGGVLPFASYDSGGFLPEGISLAHNGTGAPEPVGHGLGGGDLHVTLEVDGHALTKTVIRGFRQKAARR